MSHPRINDATVRRLLVCLAILLPLGSIVALRYVLAQRQPLAPRTQPVAQATPALAAQPPFPNANPSYIPPSSVYSGPLFVLSQDYPEQLPQNRPAFLASDFKADWKGYMLKVRDYCFEGNTEVDFRVEHNKARAWYHMPWQDYGAAGREGIHGLTKEAAVQAQQLASSQTYSTGQTYAVGFFNDLGGYTIGQVWADHSHPDPSKSSRPNGFPVGTVIFKLLFVDVPTEQVPSLANPKLWQAYVTPAYKSPPTPRVIKQMALIQMDISVRTDDPQAPTGWLFGTFQYNGALNRPNPWENLIPVGLMWGNDPTVKSDGHTQVSFKTPPDKTDINPALKETVINDDPAELPPTHLGWNGRLNGPVDNPISSCMSCHMTAQVPSVAPLSPAFQSEIKYQRGDAYWMRWFQNIDCAVPFGNYGAGGKPVQGLKTLSTDFSLQLSISITNFCEATKSCGDTTNDSTSVSAKTAKILGAPSPRSRIPSAKGRTVHPIVRDVPTARPR